jgi:hypothetical protein
VGAVATSKVRSGAVNPAGKLACVIAGMTAGADCIDELDVIRAGGMPSLFDGVYAPATLGILLRERPGNCWCAVIGPTATAPWSKPAWIPGRDSRWS